MNAPTQRQDHRDWQVPPVPSMWFTRPPSDIYKGEGTAAQSAHPASPGRCETRSMQSACELVTLRERCLSGACGRGQRGSGGKVGKWVVVEVVEVGWVMVVECVCVCVCASGGSCELSGFRDYRTSYLPE